MRRLLRWCFHRLGTALCLLPLLACLATAWLWATSYRSFEHEWTAVHRGRPDARERRACGAYGFGCYQGVLVAGWQEGWRDTELRADLWDPADADWLALIMSLVARLRRQDTVWERHGLSFRASSHVEPGLACRLRIVTAPCWLLVAATAVAPAAGTIRLSRRLYVRRRRRRLGLCLRCGYDLRGNASGKCSECGTEVVAAVTKGRVTV